MFNVFFSLGFGLGLHGKSVLRFRLGLSVAETSSCRFDFAISLIGVVKGKDVGHRVFGLRYF